MLIYENFGVNFFEAVKTNYNRVCDMLRRRCDFAISADSVPGERACADNPFFMYAGTSHQAVSDQQYLGLSAPQHGVAFHSCNRFNHRIYRRSEEHSCSVSADLHSVNRGCVCYDGIHRQANIVFNEEKGGERECLN